MAEIGFKTSHQLIGILPGPVPRLLCPLLIRKRGAMQQSQTYHRCAQRAARRLLLSAEAPHEVDACPEDVLITQVKGFPQYLQDAWTSVVAPGHQLKGFFFRLF